MSLARDACALLLVFGCVVFKKRRVMLCECYVHTRIGGGGYCATTTAFYEDNNEPMTTVAAPLGC